MTQTDDAVHLNDSHGANSKHHRLASATGGQLGLSSGLDDRGVDSGSGGGGLGGLGCGGGGALGLRGSGFGGFGGALQGGGVVGSANTTEARMRAKLKFSVLNGGPVGIAGDKATLLDATLEKVESVASSVMVKGAAMMGVGNSFASAPAGQKATLAKQQADKQKATGWPLEPSWEWGARTSARRKSIKKLAFTFCPV